MRVSEAYLAIDVSFGQGPPVRSWPPFTRWHQALRVSAFVGDATKNCLSGTGPQSGHLGNVSSVSLGFRLARHK